MTDYSFSIATLGCRANQADSDRLRAILSGAGFEEKPFGESVTCSVVNTCTVTAEADRKSRQLLRRALRVLPEGGQAIGVRRNETLATLHRRGEECKSSPYAMPSG